MELALAIIGWTLFGLAIAVGMALNLVGLFGNWVILPAAVAAYFLTGMEHFTIGGLVLALIFAIIGELIEALASAWGAARFGGGKGSATAAIAGCILGGIFGTPWFPLVGTLVGACLGAFAAAALWEYIRLERTMDAAVWTGVGAAVGRVAGLLAKFCMGLAILAVLALTF